MPSADFFSAIISTIQALVSAWQGYGAFAKTVGILGVLVTVFGVVGIKMMGRVGRWTALTADTPSFVITGAIRGFGLAVMVFAIIYINQTNVQWFVAVSVVFGLMVMASVIYFDRMRREHVVRVPILDSSGNTERTWWGAGKYKNIVIGTEQQLRPKAAEAFVKAQGKHGPTSLEKFMSGNVREINNPGALWDRGLLASIANKMMIALLLAVVSAALAAFIGALAIEASGKMAP